MNLNFYDPGNASNLQALQNTLNDQLSKLDSLRNITNNLNNPQPQSTNNVPQLSNDRYYLDCGNRNDWREFLRLNYNISEEEIFSDYKLFLQAKAEIAEDNNKEKLQTMKDRIKQVDKGNQGYSKESQQVIRNYGEVNATNNTESNTANTSTINNQRPQKNTNGNENKGVKHVR